jgi:hypothetical protein
MITANSGGLRRSTFHEEWAAELTMAAYFVALRHCATNRWLDLQLELWRALSATVAAGWGSDGIAVRVDDILAELADVAYRVALPYGRRLSFLDLELELYQTFRRAVKEDWAAPILCGAPAR